jgi:hypothetical protein
MPRRVRNQKTLSEHEALQILRDCYKRLRTVGRIDNSQSQQVKDAIKILHEVQESTKRNKYKLFLQDLLETDDGAGPALVMLCAIALGQAKIAHMNKATRSALLSRVKGLSGEFGHPILRSLASSEGLYSRNGMLLLRIVRRELTFADPRFPHQNVGPLPGIQNNGEVEQTQVTASGRREFQVSINTGAILTMHHQKFNSCSQERQQITYTHWRHSSQKPSKLVVCGWQNDRQATPEPDA